MQLLNSIDILNEELSASDQLGLPSQVKSSELSNLLKTLYDSSVFESATKVGPFDELIVNDLDPESIWEEINSRNKPLTRLLTNRIAKLYKSTDQIKDVVIKKSSKKSAKYESEDSETASGSESEGDSEEDAGSDEDGNGDFGDEEYHSNEDEEGSQQGEGGDEDDDYEEDVDMDTWLDRTEKQEEQYYLKLQRKEKKDAHKGAAESDEDSGSDADDMEFVQNQMYEMEDDEEGEDGAGAYSYKDFFVGKPREAGASGKDSKVKGRKSFAKKSAKPVGKKSAKDINSDEEDDEDEEEEDGERDSEQEDDEDDEDEEHGAFDEDDDDEGDEGDFDEQEGEDDFVESGSENEAPAPAPVKVVPKKPLTKHEKAKAHLSSQVAELEQELIQKKSWEMRGEVKATDRPENSLLGISADIERSSKPAPVISQEFTTSLEDMILKRVNEDRFDDVQPKKERDSRNVAASGEAPELSQEKNRQGLGEIYAEEFLAKSLNSQPEVVSKKLDAARQDALGLYQKISMQLDGLSHFYFTPRAVVADAAITTLATKTALSSLELEDILPGMESSASQFAPGQVLEKRKGRDASLMSKEELTSDDRKRLRRARKNARSDSEDSDAEQKGGKAGRKQQRAKDDKHLDDELRRDKRVTLNGKSSKHGGGTNGDENQNGEYSKSASFFEKLQQNAQSEISGVGKGEKKSKKKVVENGSGSSYKL